MKCPGCGERERLRVLEYYPPRVVLLEQWSQQGSFMRGQHVNALVRYQCGPCGAIAEHESFPLSDDELRRYGYGSGAEG